MSSARPTTPRVLHLSDLPPRGLVLVDAVQSGFPVDWVDEIAVRLSLSRRALAPYLGFSESTLHRRMSQGRLTTAESDRLYRLASTLDQCTALFEGNAEAAAVWMLRPQFGLGGHRPIELLSTHTGTELVTDLICRLEHGIVA
ncbi:antitoxin Xre-like helix-turn-helix domain-containing protein [Pseudomonas sp. GCM10022186]|uniref:type II RES/Xre toxin-antitoxin system antitoxin n=1 Tax=Pseudomonas sp. GCM10022186 TaxID=3252650 RepID=UPI00361DB67A